MPLLPFDRNAMHLMGSYLTNLALNLQRVLPYVQRCGDLMSRESLLTNANQRVQAGELAIVVGEALEEIARSTGSVAHLYKTIEIGPQPG